MGNQKENKKSTSKKVTRYSGDTKMSKENKEALKVVRSFKGMFG
ncbi:hypothetical protein ACOQFO_01655 [Ureibacillus sp. MALMAid1270]